MDKMTKKDMQKTNSLASPIPVATAAISVQV
jgi:hypothetical protein